MIGRLEQASSRTPVSPQLAVRVAILGGFALVMFGIIFFRLWYLQVLSGPQYLQQANANRVRDLPIPAPRGEILGREGKPLATTRITNAVQIEPTMMPVVLDEQATAYQAALVKAQTRVEEAKQQLKGFLARHHRSSRFLSRSQRTELRHLQRMAGASAETPVPPLPRSAVGVRSLFSRLGRVIGLSPRTIDERVVQGITATPYANVTIKTDAGWGALTVLAERQNEFPGVVNQPVAVRQYTYKSLGAQILGYVGQISPVELKLPGFRGVSQGTVVGKGGVEYYYDRYLRGQPGIQRVQVNASGQPVPASLQPTPPKAGYDLKLTLDIGLQREGETALQQGMELAHSLGNPGNAGAFVALDPRNGQILAMGSYPTFDPNELVKPLTPGEYHRLIGSSGAAPAPLEDRAAEGAYPTGSTFKPITAMASLEAGTISPSETLGAGQCIVVGAEEFCNAGKTDYGALPLVEALKVSSDTYFFEVGKRDYYHGNGEAVQEEAHRLGIGTETGVDLPADPQGVVPDSAWRDRQNKLERECEQRKHIPSCGIVAEIAPWRVGDNMHLAVGQGDLVTSPLQMAVAYSTLANAYMNHGDGVVVTPHLGMDIEEPQGGLVQTLSFPPKRHVQLDYEHLSQVMEGIHDATSQPGGTSQDVWTGWNQSEHPVYGKTGTAERVGQVEQAWYMCYIYDPRRPIVFAVTVEQGGFGDQAAAPVARLMASEWFHEPEKLVSGSNPDH
ncbi:MAG TPA: penicillin-binding transpeptidase domain-containing protein [Solirubrobacteraceae bacterium]|jgi:penicillin-binding protein 2